MVKQAAIIIIGNEILSGRTQDRNLAYIGKRLQEVGVVLAEARVIPDIEEVIINTVNQCRETFDYVFTTGGIGPTHDDITTASIAKAIGVDIERRQEAVEIMQNYYGTEKVTEARLKMADIPVGATLIDNPVSGAPGYEIENVFVLPGVPDILQPMLDGMLDRLSGGAPILTKTVITNLRESVMAKELEAVQNNYDNINIGSYPFFKQGKLGVNLVMQSTDADKLEKCVDDLHNMIDELDGKVFDDLV